MKGMVVRVYKQQDCGHQWGLPSQGMDKVLLIGDGIPETFETQHDQPVFLSIFRLVRRALAWGDYLHIEPVEERRGGCYAFGSNYVFSDEPGFPSRYLIPIHDRWIPNNYPFPD